MSISASMRHLTGYVTSGCKKVKLKVFCLSTALLSAITIVGNGFARLLKFYFPALIQQNDIQFAICRLHGNAANAGENSGGCASPCLNSELFTEQDTV